VTGLRFGLKVTSPVAGDLPPNVDLHHFMERDEVLAGGHRDVWRELARSNFGPVPSRCRAIAGGRKGYLTSHH
jgi:hypothetical protein